MSVQLLTAPLRVADEARPPILLITPVPRLLLDKQDAATALGMSVDSFERYVMSHLRAVRKGRLRLFPVSELERWVAENAARAPAV